MLRALIRLAGQKYLNLSQPAASGYEAREIGRPALWMDAAQLDNLLADLRHVAARATPGPLS